MEEFQISRNDSAAILQLYLVGKDRYVVYAGGLGLWGFKPNELSEAIDKYLARDA